MDFLTLWRRIDARFATKNGLATSLSG